tara:strand:- start:3208 stop:3588 length:381 start_codon:yes stop_codon:yes gene_type:complete
MGKITWANAPTEQEKREALAARLGDIRKREEAKGVTVNGARFSGDPANRQALNEALQMAERLGATTFTSWKDSDNQFHANYAVADVDNALVQIGQRRQALIAKESEFASQVLAGTITDVANLDWTV